MKHAVKKSVLLSVCALSLPGGVTAAAAGKTSAEMFNSGYLLQVFGSLLLVFACLFGLMLVLKKLNGMPAHNRGVIQVLGSAKVGSREKIVLLRAGEQHLLIGVANGSVRTLHTFDGEVAGLKGGDTGAVSDFGALLQASSSS